jgi:hypothetical protein
MIEEIEHREFKRCLKISNRDTDIIVSLDFGPRILSYALDGGENILGWHPEAGVNTDLGIWDREVADGKLKTRTHQIGDAGRCQHMN